MAKRKPGRPPHYPAKLLPADLQPTKAKPAVKPEAHKRALKAAGLPEALDPAPIQWAASLPAYAVVQSASGQAVQIPRGTHVKTIARAYTPEVLFALLDLALSPRYPPAARVAAAKEVLDRGWGKAITPIALGVAELDDNTLAELAATILQGRGLQSGGGGPGPGLPTPVPSSELGPLGEDGPGGPILSQNPTDSNTLNIMDADGELEETEQDEDEEEVD